MNSDLFYLKSNVVIEPLIDRWYAWSHLVSPATYARNITGRHLPIMESYIQAPQLHREAAKNPKLLGGPFMDFGEDRTADIVNLHKATMVQNKELIELSQGMDQLNQLLRDRGKGYSLESLYSLVPEILRGYVELVYDLNHNASFRLFEILLYKAKYYKKSSQSVALWCTNNDDRPFVLSTPRLDNEETLLLNIPFESEFIDKCSQLKRHPTSLNKIHELFEFNPDSSKFLNSLLTTKAPLPYNPYEGEKIRMRYFGHACIFLETASFNILVDPLISYYGYQFDVSRFTENDLPDNLDYVLITHNHQDHILFETLLPLRHKIQNLIIPKTKQGSLQDPSLALMFKHIGFNNVIEIDDLQTIQFPDCQITGIPFIGEHADLDIRSKICHHIRIDNFTILFVADSCNIEPALYQHIQKEIGNVDVVFLGMECDGAPLSWLYGPLLSQPLAREMDFSRRLSGSNFEQGLFLADVFNPKELYVYAMGQEPWIKFVSTKEYTEQSGPIIESNKLIATCREKGITAERLYGEKELFYDKILKIPFK